MNDQTTIPATASRPKQNGQTRPTPGTLTGLVWDYADALLSKNAQLEKAHVVPTIGEVKELYKQVQGAQDSTAATQYGRWLIYHNLRDALKQRRDAEKVEKPGAAEKEAAKAKKAEEKAAAAAKKVADKEAAKQAKADAAKAKADEKAAAKKAKDDAKAAAAAQAAEDAKAKAEAAAQAAAAAAANAG